MSGKRIWNTTLKSGANLSSADLERVFSEVHDALTTVCGLVQTDYPGQLTSFSGLTPAAANSTTAQHGFRMYRMNDNAQTDNPIFCRVNFIDFRGTAQSIHAIRISFTFATSEAVAAGAEPGNSVFCSTTSHLNENSSYLYGTAGSFPGRVSSKSFACGGEGFFWIALGVSARTYPTTEVNSSSYSFRPVNGDSMPGIFFGLERSKADPSGFCVFGHEVNSNNSGNPSGVTDIITSPVCVSIVGGSVLRDRLFLSAPNASAVASFEGSAIMYRAFQKGLTSGNLNTCSKLIAGVGCQTLAAEDVLTEVDLAGDGELRDYIFPTRLLAPLECALPARRQMIAPILLWEGETV